MFRADVSSRDTLDEARSSHPPDRESWRQRRKNTASQVPIQRQSLLQSLPQSCARVAPELRQSRQALHSDSIEHLHIGSGRRSRRRYRCQVRWTSGKPILARRIGEFQPADWWTTTRYVRSIHTSCRRSAMWAATPCGEPSCGWGPAGSRRTRWRQLMHVGDAHLSRERGTRASGSRTRPRTRLCGTGQSASARTSVTQECQEVQECVRHCGQSPCGDIEGSREGRGKPLDVLILGLKPTCQVTAARLLLSLAIARIQRKVRVADPDVGPGYVLVLGTRA